VLILGFGCNTPEASLDNTSTISQPHLATEERTIIEGKSGLYDVEVDYPVIVEPVNVATQAFNQYIEYLLKNQFIQEFKIKAEQAGAPPVTDVPFVLSGSYEVLELEPDYIAVRLFFTDYLGGTHPAPWTYTVDYVLEGDGKLVADLNDIFSVRESQYLARLSELSRPLILSQLQEKIDTQWVEKGTRPIKSNYKNFNLTSEGIKFTFDPYQVASYAEGMLEFTIPYSELTDILNVNGPVSHIKSQTK
jgi:predicted transcriptional regulator